MTPTCITVDHDLVTPDDEEHSLDEYHSAIEELTGTDVIGVTGRGSSIRQIVLSDETDVSELEDWLGADLSLDQP